MNNHVETTLPTPVVPKGKLAFSAFCQKALGNMLNVCVFGLFVCFLTHTMIFS